MYEQECTAKLALLVRLLDMYTCIKHGYVGSIVVAYSIC